MDWLSTIPPTGWFVVALAAGALAAVAFVLGRRTSAQVAHIKELGAALGTARAETLEVQEALDAYRGRVSNHFTETSEKLHDLTLHYRTVYDHLAKGAAELCPEGFGQLEGGLGGDALPEVLETDGGIDPQPVAAFEAERQASELARDDKEVEEATGESAAGESKGEPVAATPGDVRPLS